MSVDLCVEGATYHTSVRFCCQSQVHITYIFCVRCILRAVQSHMIINQKGMRITYRRCSCPVASTHFAQGMGALSSVHWRLQL